MVAPTPNGIACGEIESMTLKALDAASARKACVDLFEPIRAAALKILTNEEARKLISGRGCELPATPASGTHSVAALDRSRLVCNRPPMRTVESLLSRRYGPHEGPPRRGVLRARSGMALARLSKRETLLMTSLR